MKPSIIRQWPGLSLPTTVQLFQNHAGVVRQDTAGGDGHLFTCLRIASPAILLAFHLEVAEPGDLQFPLLHDDLLDQFEQLIR